MKRIALLLFLLAARPLSAANTDAPSKDYSIALAPVWERMASMQSEHFEVWTEKRDEFLAPRALDALEAAYSRIGEVFGEFPDKKIRVEIYRTKEDFSLASTLSDEILTRSGAIGICKFGRLMILTPEQLAFGYRWLDTLAHEYTHYLVNEVSDGLCPLWLHEGTAKYLETLWRLDSPDYLSPGNRTELARAVKDDRLIPFDRMAPSMVYLKDQDEVRLAFSQVAHALHFVETSGGRAGIRKFIENAPALDTKKFEESWKEFLTKDNLAESPGAAPDKLKIGPGNELEDLASVNIQGHIRLGDRLRLAGKPAASLVQYRKALEKEPFNPVALTRLARAKLALDDPAGAVETLEAAARENPNYAPAFALLGKLYLEKKDIKSAKKMFLEGFALNPFDPGIQMGLSQVREQQGN